MEAPTQAFEVLNTNRDETTGATAVHYWATNDLVENFEIAAKDSQNDLNVKDFYGNTALHYASISKSYKVAEFLISRYPKERFVNLERVSPAHLAAQQGDTKMLAILSASETMFNETTHKNWTPLDYAIFFEQIDAVKFLVAKYKPQIHMLVHGTECTNSHDPNHLMKYFSPLDIARKVGNQEIIDLLIKNNAMPSLHTAAWSNHKQAVSYLVSSKHTKIDINETAHFKNLTALHIAACRGYYPIIRFLLTRGASTKVLSDDGMCPLEYAVFSKNLPSIQILSEASSAEHRSLALCVAASIGSKEAADIIMRDRIEPNIKASDGDPLLVRLLKCGLFEAASKLTLDPALDFSAADRNGATAAHIAAAVTGCDWNCAGQNQGKIDDLNVSTLLMRTLKNGLAEQQDNFGRTPVVYAIAAGNKQAIEQKLLSEQLTNDHVDKFGFTPYLLQIALGGVSSFNNDWLEKRAYTIELREFINHPIAERSRPVVPDLDHFRMRTVDGPDVRLVGKAMTRALESQNIKSYAEHGDGRLRQVTALHITILFECLSGIIMQLVNQVPSLINMPDGDGRTPMMFAAFLDRPRIVATIQQKNPILAVFDAESCNFFHFVKSTHMLDSLKLNNNGDILLMQDSVNIRGQLPLHMAAALGDVELLGVMCRMMPDVGKVINKKDIEMLTPLDYAFRAGHTEAARLLYQKGAINYMVEAAAEGNWEQVQFYLEHGMPINAADGASLTALHAAARANHRDVVIELLNRGADPGVKMSNGRLAVHFAAEHNDLELCKMLLKRVDLAPIAPDDQPYRLPSDKATADFLCVWWKRSYFISMFFDVVRRNLSMTASIRIAIKNGDSRHKTSTYPIAEKVLDTIDFVSKTTLRRSEDQHFDMHEQATENLTNILETVPLEEYVGGLREATEGILKKGGSRAAAQASMEHLSALLFPVRWFEYVIRVVRELAKFHVDEIDNRKSMDSLVERLNDRLAHALQATRQVSSQFSKAANECMRGRIDIVSQSGSPGVTAQGRFTSVLSRPSVINSASLFAVLRRFFGSDGVLSRRIPFLKDESVNVFVAGGILNVVSVSSAHVFHVPLDMAMVTATRDSHGTAINAITPVGALSVFLPTSMATTALVNHIHYTRQIALDEAELRFQTRKGRVFRCLVSFYTGTHKHVQVRDMLVVAGREAECFDLCQVAVREELTAAPIYFNVNAVEVAAEEEEIFMLD